MVLKFEFFILKMQVNKIINQKSKTHNRLSINLTFNNHILHFGYFGIKSQEFGKLTLDQIFYLNQILNNELRSITKKKIKIWNKITVNLTSTKLSLGTRMGKGKGPVKEYFSYIKSGQVLFEIEKITKRDINNVFSKIQKKISFKIKLINRIY